MGGGLCTFDVPRPAFAGLSEPPISSQCKDPCLGAFMPRFVGDLHPGYLKESDAILARRFEAAGAPPRPPNQTAKNEAQPKRPPRKPRFPKNPKPEG